MGIWDFGLDPVVGRSCETKWISSDIDWVATETMVGEDVDMGKRVAGVMRKRRRWVLSLQLEDVERMFCPHPKSLFASSTQSESRSSHVEEVDLLYRIANEFIEERLEHLVRGARTRVLRIVLKMAIWGPPPCDWT